MISYEFSTKHSNKIEKHIVGHIYKATNNGYYLFLGKGHYTTNRWANNGSEDKWAYMRIMESGCYMKGMICFENILENIEKQGKTAVNYVHFVQKSHNFIEDCGKLYEYNDTDFCIIHTQTDITEYGTYVTEINFEENKNHVNNIQDTSYICNIEALMQDVRTKSKQDREQKLLGCPFCGKSGKNLYKNWEEKSNVSTYVCGCKNCEIYFKSDDMIEAVNKWNTRHYWN